MSRMWARISLTSCPASDILASVAGLSGVLPWACTFPALVMTTPGAENEAIGPGVVAEGLGTAGTSEYLTWPSVTTAT